MAVPARVYRTHLVRNIGIVVIVLAVFLLLPIVPTTFTSGRFGFSSNTTTMVSLSYATLGCGLVYVTGSSSTTPIGTSSSQPANRLVWLCGNNAYPSQ